MSATHDLVGATQQIQTDTNELRDHIADFDDFFRPLRNYFYWEPHCFDIPLCAAVRSLFDSLDGIDEVTRQAQLRPEDILGVGVGVFGTVILNTRATAGMLASTMSAIVTLSP